MASAMYNLRSRRDGLQASTAILGSDHPLTRAIDSLRKVRRQALVVSAVLLGSAIDLSEGRVWAPAVIISAALVALGLVLVGTAFEQRKRDRALDLIVDGRESVPVAAVERVCERLRAPRTQRQMARTIDRMVDRALSPPRPCMPGARPLFRISVVASVAVDLRVISQLLRTERASVRGVALIERLLRDGGSLFYGDDPRQLCEELHRIEHALRA